MNQLKTSLIKTLMAVAPLSRGYKTESIHGQTNEHITALQITYASLKTT